jgi:hypothetical protein
MVVLPRVEKQSEPTHRSLSSNLRRLEPPCEPGLHGPSTSTALRWPYEAANDRRFDRAMRPRLLASLLLFGLLAMLGYFVARDVHGFGPNIRVANVQLACLLGQEHASRTAELDPSSVCSR